MPTKRRATYQDVLDAPNNVVAELVDGTLHLSPRPGGPHASVASLLGAELIHPFFHGRGGGPGGWLIIDEPELHLAITRRGRRNESTRVLVPDLAGWRTSRMPAVPEGAKFTITPDWVCEVVSASTESYDLKTKLPVYAEACVAYFWRVKPVLRSLEVMRLDRGRWTLLDVYSDNAKVRAEPFDAIELDLRTLWSAMPLRASEAWVASELGW